MSQWIQVDVESLEAREAAEGERLQLHDGAVDQREALQMRVGTERVRSNAERGGMRNQALLEIHMTGGTT